MGGVRTHPDYTPQTAYQLLQWGPPGMGGVRFVTPVRIVCQNTLLQWGPPGMGGVRLPGWRPIRAGSRYFNGDLPEWEV